jgi:hypothetical protein
MRRWYYPALFLTVALILGASMFVASKLIALDPGSPADFVVSNNMAANVLVAPARAESECAGGISTIANANEDAVEIPVNSIPTIVTPKDGSEILKITNGGCYVLLQEGTNTPQRFSARLLVNTHPQRWGYLQLENVLFKGKVAYFPDVQIVTILPDPSYTIQVP